MALSNALLNAVRRYGPSVNQIGQQYGISGAALLAKVIQGESGGQAGQVSSAGARGYTQFTPGSRQVAIQKFGIDPWAGPDQAVHAAALHLRGLINGSKGLTGYNPGSSSYPGYILGQKVGNVGAGRAPTSGSSSGSGSSSQNISVTVPGQQQAGSTFDPGAGTDNSGLISALLQQQHPAPAFTPSVTPPSYSAERYLKSAGQAPQITPQAPQTGSSDLLSLLGQADFSLPQDQQTQQTPGVTVTGKIPGAPKAPASSAPVRGELHLPSVFTPTHQTSGLPGYPARDIFAKPGTPVGSPISGTVVKLSGKDPSAGAYQGQGGPFGYSVYVTDGKRTYFLTHFGSRNVKVGQKVSKGQVIGTVGNYPGATPDHIHVGLNQR